MVSTANIEECVFGGMKGRKVAIQGVASTIPSHACGTAASSSSSKAYWTFKAASLDTGENEPPKWKAEVVHMAGNLSAVPQWGLSNEIPAGVPAALLLAYAYHSDVVLRPDDVWIMICYGLAEYINADPEQYRSMFVDHEGKKKLQIVRPEPFNAMNWEAAVQDFAGQIKDNIKTDLASAIACDFTTTGRIEYIASLISLMTAMKHYFEYDMTCGSGIRNVIFMGTLEDWQKLRAKTKALEQYGLQEWVAKMLYIVDNFIETYKGNSNLAFWNYMVDKVDGVGASGMRTPKSDYNGWLISFYPFDRDGHPVRGPMRRGDFPDVVLHAPVTALDVTTGKNHNLKFMTGFTSIRVENQAFCPELSYAFADLTPIL